MKLESEREKLSKKLKDLKKIIGIMNSDIVMMINLSAQVENKLKAKQKFSKKEAVVIGRALNQTIKAHIKPGSINSKVK